MREKARASDGVVEDENPGIKEFELQADRIRKILDESICKLKLLTFLPHLLENDGEILRQHLNKTEVDFIVLVCQENSTSKHLMADRSDLMMISNMLDRINMFEKSKNSPAPRRKRSFFGADNMESHVAYVVDILFKSKSLVEYLGTLVSDPDALITTFIDSVVKLRHIADIRLRTSATEEIKRENDLKTAYRSSMLLSDNIQDLEEQLEKQRQELGKEYDRKQAILEDLVDKIDKMKEKAKKDINQIVYDSEILMMKDYNKSSEQQEELAADAKESTEVYEKLLEEHLNKEKTLRMKRLKVETQLASWIAKYDADIGERQAEYEKLEETYNAEKDEFELLQEKFDEQEEEYLLLMTEKEEEERRIYEEKAWIYLQNRAARKIQRYWRAYWARKLARKKGRKSKKKGSAEGKGKKGKKSPRSPKDKKEDKTNLRGGPDPNALIDNKFSKEVLSEIKKDDAFAQKDVVVDLIND